MFSERVEGGLDSEICNPAATIVVRFLESIEGGLVTQRAVRDSQPEKPHVLCRAACLQLGEQFASFRLLPRGGADIREKHQPDGMVVPVRNGPHCIECLVEASQLNQWKGSVGTSQRKRSIELALRGESGNCFLVPASPI